jgi:hypothetical protein
MNSATSFPASWVREKASFLGLPEEMLSIALELVNSNRNLMNVMDHTTEMDEYIYKALLRYVLEKKQTEVEHLLIHGNLSQQSTAQQSLAVLSREELSSNPFYRAVIPLLIKVTPSHAILRIHAEEASALVILLGDVKRKFRCTSLSELIVRYCQPSVNYFLQ